MLFDLYILKSGLPIFTHSFNDDDSQSGKQENTDDEQITMISGFFSAINSFAATVGNYGHIRELKMNNVKFSFLRLEEDECSDMLFVCSSTCQLKQEKTEKFLGLVAGEFIRTYPEILTDKWKGKTDIFENFYQKLMKIVSLSFRNSRALRSQLNYPLASKVSEKRLRDRISVNSIREHNLDNQKLQQKSFNKLKHKQFVPYDKHLFYNLVPIKRVAEDENIYDVFSGRDSRDVYRSISGKENIKQISESTGLNKKRVFHLCKSFIKMGLISFTN